MSCKPVFSVIIMAALIMLAMVAHLTNAAPTTDIQVANGTTTNNLLSQSFDEGMAWTRPIVTHFEPSNSTSSLLDLPTENWARFCNDRNCTEGCGQWVDIANPGCLTENYRGSFHLKSGGLAFTIGLVYSPAETCDCQLHCWSWTLADGGSEACATLDSELAYKSHSYRFINSGMTLGCDYKGSNCPASD